MNPLFVRVARRLLWTVGALSAAAWLMSQPVVSPLALNGQDGLLFFLSAAMFAAILPRLARFYTAPVISSSQIFSFGMSCLAVGFVVSTMSSVHWRGAGHIASVNDGPARVVFRELYIVYAAISLLTAGNFEPDVFRSAAVARWRHLAYVVGAALAMLALLSYGDRATLWLWTRPDMHDAAPVAPDTDGVP